MLALVPFDICSIDSGTVGNNRQQQQPQSGGGSEETTLVGAISGLAIEYLTDPGPTRDAAAVCLASLLKRPDMEVGEVDRRDKLGYL